MPSYYAGTLPTRTIISSMRAFPAALLLASLSPAATNLKSLDIAAIDKTCKPCDDFYQYAIGAWHAANPIPASQTRLGKRWAAADGNREVLRGIIEPLTSTAAKSPAQKNIGAFYTSCMDTAAIDKAGATPIQPLLASFRSLTTVPSVSAAIAQMNGLGLDTLFATTPVPYTEDPNQVVAGIRPGTQGLPDRDYYLKDDPKSKATREQYQAYIQKLFILAGARQPEAIAAAATVLRIETSLARSQMSRVEYRDPQKTNNHLQAAQLEELVPHLDWDHYFRAIGAPASNLVRLSDLGWMKEAERQLTESDPIHHNGKLVLGESIGDLAGARIAFTAYMKSIVSVRPTHPPAITSGWQPTGQA